MLNMRNTSNFWWCHGWHKVRYQKYERALPLQHTSDVLIRYAQRESMKSPEPKQKLPMELGIMKPEAACTTVFPKSSMRRESYPFIEPRMQLRNTERNSFLSEIIQCEVMLNEKTYLTRPIYRYQIGQCRRISCNVNYYTFAWQNRWGYSFHWHQSEWLKYNDTL